jgi:hypothetical protein
MPASQSLPRPVIVLLHRCSSWRRGPPNHLWDLLRLHADCAAGRSPIWEDYLVRNSTHLVQFVDAAQGSWDPVWGPTHALRPELMRVLGDALLQFLTVEPDRRLVTKSPSLENLERFFDFFPDANLLLLVRDGRDVVASGMVTFGWELEEAARAWATGVDRALQFLERPEIPRNQCTLVRYEDLVEQPGAEMRRIMRSTGLDEHRYDFDAVEKLPVRGSSTHLGQGRSDVHWDPVPRTQSFRSVQRWKSWDARARRQFSAVAGPQLSRLGYEH